MTKIITESQRIGEQGESFAKERANAMGFMFSRHGPLEAGIDGFLEVRDPETKHATGQIVAAQIKTKAHGLYAAENGSGFEYLMDAADVTYWRDCNLPVIIILVHLERKVAYWKSVETGEGLGHRRLRIDKTQDVFDTNARDRIANLCVTKGGFGVYFPPLQKEDSGYLNMLEVLLPRNIFIAVSPFKNGKQALGELLEHEERPPDDWVIRGGQFMSFRDPRNSPLLSIIDVGTVEKFQTEEVVFPDDEADEYNIIELMRRTLGMQFDGLLTFSRSQFAFYFPANPETINEVYQYKSLKKYTSASVVHKYEKNGKLTYVRHHAFEPRFWRINYQWFLSVTPTFVFTWDGFRPDKFASSRLAGKKQREHNSALIGQFAMWCHLLTRADKTYATKSLFGSDPNNEWMLNFKALESFNLPYGVPDDLWRSTEREIPDGSAQGRLAI